MKTKVQEAVAREDTKPRRTVSIDMKVLTVFHSSVDLNDQGRTTIGSIVDEMIREALSAGEHPHSMTIDLSAVNVR